MGKKRLNRNKFHKIAETFRLIFILAIIAYVFIGYLSGYLYAWVGGFLFIIHGVIFFITDMYAKKSTALFWAVGKDKCLVWAFNNLVAWTTIGLIILFANWGWNEKPLLVISLLALIGIHTISTLVKEKGAKK